MPSVGHRGRYLSGHFCRERGHRGRLFSGNGKRAIIWKPVVNKALVTNMQKDVSALISETVVAIFQVNGKMLEWGDAFTAPFGLTSARWQILGAIARAGQQQTAPLIAEQMGMSRQGAQKQLNLLVDGGLVERLPNPAHLRSPLYRLTRKGESLFHRVNTAWETHAAHVGKLLPVRDLEPTLRTLRHLLALYDASQGENHNES